MRKSKDRLERRDQRQAGMCEAQELDARRVQRLKTVETLRHGRTPLHVIAAAEHAATLADQSIDQAMQRDPPRPPLACREGCAWCCHKVVGTSAAEVLRISTYLRNQLSPQELQLVQERVVHLNEERRSPQQDRWAAARLPCPLLVNNRCSVYPVRPLTCRGYNSSDASRCEKLVTTRERVEVPSYAAQHRLAVFVLDGLRAGLAEAGLNGDLLELTAALRIALSRPDTAERWLDSEPVFAPARLP
jgi:Fe-S-cluster containining protein